MGRAILGTLTVEGICQDRDRFAQLVREVASPDVGKVGIEILSFTIKDVYDRVDYLTSLGKARTAAVKRDADIGVAKPTETLASEKRSAKRRTWTPSSWLIPRLPTVNGSTNYRRRRSIKKLTQRERMRSWRTNCKPRKKNKRSATKKSKSKSWKE